MSEQAAVYNANPPLLSYDELRRRQCCYRYDDERYRAPTGQEIKSLMSYAKWSQEDFAYVVGVATSANPGTGSSIGSSTIRRWLSSSDSSGSIPYAAWRLALLESKVVTLD